MSYVAENCPRVIVVKDKHAMKDWKSLVYRICQIIWYELFFLDSQNQNEMLVQDANDFIFSETVSHFLRFFELAKKWNSCFLRFSKHSKNALYIARFTNFEGRNIEYKLSIYMDAVLWPHQNLLQVMVIDIKTVLIHYSNTLACHMLRKIVPE